MPHRKLAFYKLVFNLEKQDNFVQNVVKSPFRFF